ncbi:MAG TPA: cupin domain-containing protein [Actinomycetota bacterium]|nr:cupin domain-containing protein [Actinomycetota bacterium]
MLQLGHEVAPTVVGPGEGLALLAGGSGTVFKLFSAEAGGRLSLVEHPVDPGVLIPPHVHSREDQISLILEGTVDMLVGEKTFRCPAGSYVTKPRGLPHAFWNPTAQPARLLEISLPGGVEHYMRSMFEHLLATAGSPDPKVLHALADAYGITLAPELAVQLCGRHGVRLMGTRSPGAL